MPPHGLAIRKVGEAAGVKESPIYEQYRIHTAELPSGQWIASIVNIGKRKLITKNSLTMAVTRIPGEYDSEVEAVLAAKDYIDRQAQQEEGT